MTPGVPILSMSGQAWLFLSTVLVGAGIGLFFDVFRILRKTVPFLAKSFAVQLEDLFFWITVTGGTFYFMLNQNYGEIRIFSVLGAGVGIALYFAAVSRFVLLVFVTLIEYMKKVVTVALRIIFFPLRLIATWVSPPLKFLYGKIRSLLHGLRRYCKIRTRKFWRSWFILRKKV